MSRTDGIRTTVREMLIDAYPDSTAPGAAALLVKGGQILCRTASAGQTSNTRFRSRPTGPSGSASLSKPLTCSEAGALTLRTPAGDQFTLQPLARGDFFFPEIPESRLIFSSDEDCGTTLEWRPRRGIPVHARKTS